MPERTDHNEAMRLADRISPETDWYEFDQVTWCNEAAALLRQQAEQIDQLRAEVERLKPNAERWEYALNSEEFAVCEWGTVFGEPCWVPISEESAIDAARTTHKETE